MEIIFIYMSKINKLALSLYKEDRHKLYKTSKLKKYN